MNDLVNNTRETLAELAAYRLLNDRLGECVDIARKYGLTAAEIETQYRIISQDAPDPHLHGLRKSALRGALEHNEIVVVLRRKPGPLAEIKGYSLWKSFAQAQDEATLETQGEFDGDILFANPHLSKRMQSDGNLDAMRESMLALQHLWGVAGDQALTRVFFPSMKPGQLIGFGFSKNHDFPFNDISSDKGLIHLHITNSGENVQVDFGNLIRELSVYFSDEATHAAFTGRIITDQVSQPITGDGHVVRIDPSVTGAQIDVVSYDDGPSLHCLTPRDFVSVWRPGTNGGAFLCPAIPCRNGEFRFFDPFSGRLTGLDMEGGVSYLGKYKTPSAGAMEYQYASFHEGKVSLHNMCFPKNAMSDARTTVHTRTERSRPWIARHL